MVDLVITHFQQVILIGLDDASLVGAPQQMYVGSLDELRRPDAVIMDRRGYERLWPDEPLRVGKTLEMNDRRAVLVGVCEAPRTFQTFRKDGVGRAGLVTPRSALRR